MLYCSFECEVATFPYKYCIYHSYIYLFEKDFGSMLITGVSEHRFKLSPSECQELCTSVYWSVTQESAFTIVILEFVSFSLSANSSAHCS